MPPSLFLWWAYSYLCDFSPGGMFLQSFCTSLEVNKGQTASSSFQFKQENPVDGFDVFITQWPNCPFYFICASHFSRDACILRVHAVVVQVRDVERFWLLCCSTWCNLAASAEAGQHFLLFLTEALSSDLASDNSCMSYTWHVKEALTDVWNSKRHFWTCHRSTMIGSMLIWLLPTMLPMHPDVFVWIDNG